MTSTRNPKQLLGLGSTLIRILTEFARMGLVSGDEKQGTRRDSLNVVERVEVHELGVRRERGMSRQIRRRSLGRERATARTVEIKELAVHRGGGCRELVRGSAGVLSLAAFNLRPALSCGLLDDLLARSDILRMLDPVATSGAHVVHAGCGDGFEARVDLGRADHVPSASTDTDGADALSVDEALVAEIVNRCTERFGKKIGRYAVARLALTSSPEAVVQRDRHKALLGQLGGVQVGGLLLDGAHGVADDDGGRLGAAVGVVADEEVARHRQLVEVLEGNRLNRDVVAAVEVVRAKRHVLGGCEHGVQSHAECGEAASHNLHGVDLF